MACVHSNRAASTRRNRTSLKPRSIRRWRRRPCPSAAYARCCPAIVRAHARISKLRSRAMPVARPRSSTSAIWRKSRVIRTRQESDTKRPSPRKQTTPRPTTTLASSTGRSGGSTTACENYAGPRYWTRGRPRSWNGSSRSSGGAERRGTRSALRRLCFRSDFDDLRLRDLLEIIEELRERDLLERGSLGRPVVFAFVADVVAHVEIGRFFRVERHGEAFARVVVVDAHRVRIDDLDRMGWVHRVEKRDHELRLAGHIHVAHGKRMLHRVQFVG